MCVCIRVLFKKVESSTQKESKKQYSFSLFFNIVHLDISKFGSMMFKHCNPITEEGAILVSLHSIYSVIVISKSAMTQVEFEFRKQEKVR